MKAVVALIGLSVGCWFFAAPAFAQGQGRGQGKGKGVGPSVSQLAKNGVHGQQLAALVHRLQAAQGIGQANAGGRNAKAGGPGMKGGKGGR